LTQGSWTAALLETTTTPANRLMVAQIQIARHRNHPIGGSNKGE